MAKISPCPERLIIVVCIDNNQDSDQEAKTNVSIRVNYFGIILEVTSNYRGGVRDGSQRQPTFSFIRMSRRHCVHIC